MNEKRLASQYRNVFSTPDGEDVLADLRAEFYDTSLVGKDAHATAVVAGAHTVVRYILNVMEDTSDE